MAMHDPLRQSRIAPCCTYCW